MIALASKNWIRILLVLVFYILVVLFLTEDRWTADEGSHIQYARNITNGFYSPADPKKLDLWHGPGYPLIIAPFVAVKLPDIFIKILNAFLLWGAVLFFYFTARHFSNQTAAFWATMAFALYPPFLQGLPLIMSETLAIFLVAGFTYFWCTPSEKTDKAPGWRMVIAAFFLAWLALTKVFYGYVILALLIFYALTAVARRKPEKKSLLTLLVALLFCTPYLAYTYSLTHKPFYWGNSGGSSLYWMSTPFKEEVGDWQSPERVQSNKILREHHAAFLDECKEMESLQKDEALKRKAVHNIRTYPLKFLQNCLCNAGRLVFSYPFNFRPPNAKRPLLILLGIMIPNAVLFTCLLLSLYPAWIHRRHIPSSLHMPGLLALTAFGGSSLLSAYFRQFLVLVPLIGIWLVFAYTHLVKITVRTQATDNSKQPSP